MKGLDLPKKRVFFNDAPLWKRSVAFFIDLILLQIILGPFGKAFMGTFTDDFMKNYEFIIANPDVMSEFMIIIILFSIMIYAYFVIYLYKLKQTPGMIIFNLHLVEKDKKKPLTLLRILLRSAPSLIIIPFIYVLWIVNLFYLFTKGEKLTDQLAETKIVEEIKV